jgi:hypothetical protein
MGASATIKDVQKLTGCMAALNRFICWLLARGERTALLQDPKAPRQVPVDRGGRASPTRPSVSSSPYSTIAGRRSTTLHCGNNSCYQQCYCSRARQGRPCIWSAEACIFRQ